jgi:hypothetical protein
MRHLEVISGRQWSDLHRLKGMAVALVLNSLRDFKRDRTR